MRDSGGDAEIRHLSEIVLEVVSAREQAARPSKDRWSALLERTTKHWALVLFCFSLVSAFLAWLFYDISPLHPLEEIAHRQSEYRESARRATYRAQMVARHLQLADSLLDVGQLAAAKVEFERVLALDPENVRAHFGKLKTEIFEPIAAHDYEPAVSEKRLRLLLKEQPEDPHAWTYMGDVYRMSDPKTAVGYYRRALASSASVASAQLGMGVAYDLLDERDKSLSALEAGVKLSPWNQQALSNLGYQYLQHKRYADAIEKYRKAMALVPDYIVSHAEIALVYLNSGRPAYAEFYQMRALELLEDAKAAEREANRGIWFYTIDKRQPVYLIGTKTKQRYVHCSLAITKLLLEEAKSSTLEMTACVKPSDGTALTKDLRRLMQYELARLRASQPKYEESIAMLNSEFE